MKKTLTISLIVLVILGIVRIGFSFQEKPSIVQEEDTIMGFPVESLFPKPMEWPDDSDGPMGFPDVMGFR
jgi:hypothetical protein